MAALDPVPSSVHGLEHVLIFALLQLSVIIVIARVSGHLTQKLGQPRAVGEMIAGLVLGPSLFGLLAPNVYQTVFRSTDNMPIGIISQIGLILLMFQIGLEFDFAHLKARGNKLAVLAVAMAGILIPFMFGLVLGIVSSPILAPDIDRWSYALFMATALSITAVPILGRIMMEYGLTHTRIGVITISAAAINDAVGWIILAVITARVTSQLAILETAWTIGYLLVYALICWWIVRRALRRIITVFRRADDALPQDLMAILLAVVFTSAIVTSQLGIFAIFGGFMIGVLLHDQHALVAAWKMKVADLVMVFFMPVFFTYTGLRTDIGRLDSPDLWLWFGLVLLLAVLGKFGGCYIAARWSGLDVAESRNVGILMNTRGLMELIIINVGLDLGIIPPPVFTMLVMMAIVSTMMTAPALRRWLPPASHPVRCRRNAAAGR